MTAIALPPTPQKTAPVHEYHCTFTHDVKRKNAKRWKDGFLKFHLFNNRILVYDESRNFVQAGHQITGASDIFDGAELSLDLVLVQVGEPMGVTQTDLSEVVKKKSPQRTADAGPRPRARLLHRSPRPRANTSLKSVIASSASSLSQTRNQHEAQKGVSQVERPTKRPRRDDNHKPLREMLNSNKKIQTPLPPAPSMQKISLQSSPTRQVHSPQSKSENRQRQTIDLMSDLPSVSAQARSSRSPTDTRAAPGRTDSIGAPVPDQRAQVHHQPNFQRTHTSQNNAASTVRSSRSRTDHPRSSPSSQPQGGSYLHLIHSQTSDDDVNATEERHSHTGLDFHVINGPHLRLEQKEPSKKPSQKPIARPKLRRPEQRTQQSSAPVKSFLPDVQTKLLEVKNADTPSEAQNAESPKTNQKKTKALRLKSRPQRRMLCQALEQPVMPPVPNAEEKPGVHGPIDALQAKPIQQDAPPVVQEPRSPVVERQGNEGQAAPQSTSQHGIEEDLFSLFVADDFVDEPTSEARPTIKDQSTPGSDSGGVLVMGSPVELSSQSSGKPATVDPRALSLRPNEALSSHEVVESSQQSGAALEADMEQIAELMEDKQENRVSATDSGPHSQQQSSSLRSSASTIMPEKVVHAATAASGNGSTSVPRRHPTIGQAASSKPAPSSAAVPEYPHEEQQEQKEEQQEEQGPWTREAWDLFGGCPAAHEARLGWRQRYDACPPALA